MHKPVYRLIRGSQRVIVIGMTHIARYEFFDRIRTLITSYEAQGYAVLFEEVGGADSRMLARFGYPYEALMELKKAAFELLRWRYGLWYQVDAIPLSETWVSADDQRPLVDSLSAEAETLGLTEFLRERSRRFTHILDDTEGWVALARQMLETWTPVQATSYRYYREEILLRNEHAIRQIAGVVIHEPVITFWGQNHIPGIVEGLLARGFAVERMDKLAFQFP